MKSVERKLNELKATTAPSREFRHVLWLELDVVYQRTYGYTIITWRRMFLMPVLGLVLVVTMGTGSYAYASPEVNPASALYPVKRGMEAVEKHFYLSPNAAAEFHTRMLDRRLAEGQVLLRVQALTPMQLQIVADEMNDTVVHVARVAPGSMVRQKLTSAINDSQEQYVRFTHICDSSRIRLSNPQMDALRNKFDDTRVRIVESDLSDEEKSALILKLQATENLILQ